MIVVVTETIENALRFAAALSGISFQGRNIKTEDLKTCVEALAVEKIPYGYFHSNILGEEAVFSWSNGAVLTPERNLQEYGEAYRQAKASGRPFFPDRLHYIVKETQQKQMQILTGLLKNQEFRNVYNACTGENADALFAQLYNHAESMLPVIKVHIKAMSDAALKESFSAASHEFAAETANITNQAEILREWFLWTARQNIRDAFSASWGKEIDLGMMTAPVLAMLVERNDRINQHKSNTAFTILGSFTDADGNAVTGRVRPTLRLATEAACTAYIQKLPTTVLVEKTYNEKEKEYPEGPLDRDTLLQQAMKILGYEPEKTQILADALHEGGFITNPNVDSRLFPAGSQAEVLASVHKLMKTSTFGPLLKGADLAKTIPFRFMSKSQNGGILLTKKLPNATCTNEMKQLYTLIAKEIVKTALPPALLQRDIISFSADKITFRVNGTTLLVPGFLCLEKPKKYQNSIPKEATEGDTFRATYTIKKITSTAVSPYTENEINEILTKQADGNSFATVKETGAIMKRLIQSGFVMRNKTQLLPTSEGIHLIHSLSGLNQLLSINTLLRWKYILAKCKKEIPLSEKEAALRTLENEVRETVTEWYQTIRQAAGEKSELWCPCHNPLYKTEDNYFCKECGFQIPKVLFGRTMKENEIGYFITHRETPVIYGFSSGSGHMWARLVMNENNEPTLTRESNYICPVCGKHLYVADDGKSAFCPGEGCFFVLPFVLYGHSLNPIERRSLLETGKTPLIHNLQAGDTIFDGLFFLDEKKQIKCVVKR